MKPGPLSSLEDPLSLGFEILNTSVFNVTGHPAMSVPCGMSDGLPIGMMLVGKQFDEATIYRAAYAFEQLGDWRRL
jgi:amidase